MFLGFDRAMPRFRASEEHHNTIASATLQALEALGIMHNKPRTLEATGTPYTKPSRVPSCRASAKRGNNFLYPS